jgi:hypothetical protein
MKFTKKLFLILMFSVASGAQATCTLSDSDLYNQVVYSGAAITIGENSTVNGNLQVVTATTVGADANVVGNIVGGKSVTLGANGVFGGNVQARDAGDIGINSTIAGNFTTGDAVTLGATNIDGNIMVGGYLKAGAAITVGVGSTVGGNLTSGAANRADLGEGVTIGGNATAGTALELGVDARVSGNAQAGTGSIDLGDMSAVVGDATAGTTVTLGAGATVGGNTTTGSITNFTNDPKGPIASHQEELTDEQARLAAMVAPAANELATTIMVDTTLEAGVYHAVALTIDDDITLTFDGKGQDGDWLINVDTAIALGARLKMKLLDVTPNSTITWNAGTSTTIGAGTTGIKSEIIGTFLVGSSLSTGDNIRLTGVGNYCARISTTNAAITLGENNTIGADGCTIDSTATVAAPDHFVINHDNSGIYCLAEAVSVTAKYADNSTATCYTGTITLNTQTGVGGWSLLNGSGSLLDPADNDGFATYSFSAAGDGVAEFSLHYPEGTTTFDIDAYQGAIRDNDVENNITFAASGFTITASELFTPPPNDPIPNQIAGTAFDAHITAFGTLPNDNTCGIIETYVGSKVLALSTAHSNPSSGSVNILSDGNATAALTFTNGKAVLPAKYKDTGQVSLSISDGTISGNSNNFVVKPASFVITPATSPFIATGPTDPNIYTSAGTDFNVTVTAKDSEGGTTPNYGNEALAETINVSHALAQPVGGSIGIFTTSLSKTGSGIFSGTANWSEVGIIDLIASVGDATYLGTGNVSTTLSNVGRFIPATLSIAPINQGIFTSTNFMGVFPFTYVGQGFSYDPTDRPSFRVTALNALSTPTPTVNYTGAWGKLNASSIALTAPTSDVTQDGTTASTRMVLTYVQDDAGFRDPTITANQPAAVDGVFDATFTYDDFTYDKDSNSQISPFNPSVNLLITSVTDGDGIASGPITLNPTGTEPIRFGRMRMYNANGSELTPLLMYYRLEYFNSGNWLLHDDMDSIIAPVDIISNPAGTSGMSISSTTLVGKFGLTLSPTGADNDAAYLITTDVLNSGEPWLTYDWDGGGNFDDNPSAIASFGIYKGNSINIYMKDTYQ